MNQPTQDAKQQAKQDAKQDVKQEDAKQEDVKQKDVKQGQAVKQDGVPEPVDLPNGISFDKANVRTRTEKGRAAIAGSVKQFGAGRSILLDKDGVIRAGNGTAEAWINQGGKIKVIETTGDELIAVKRTDMSGSEAIAYAIADNRTGELGEWVKDDLGKQLEALQQEGLDVADFGFDDVDLSTFKDTNLDELFEDAEEKEKESKEKLVLQYTEEEHKVLMDKLEKIREEKGGTNEAIVWTALGL